MQALLFVGHGDLPRAMVSSLQMIIGPNPDLYHVSLRPEDGKDEFAEKLATLDGKLSAYDKVIVFSDLLGGSPNNGSFQKYHDNEKFELIAGVNMAMALTAALSSGDASTIIQEGHNGIVNVLKPASHTTQVQPEAKSVKAKEGKPHQIKNVRVDSRGIHGQVATAWVPFLEVDRIIVIDDTAIKDETQKLALKMAKPNHVKLSILSTAKAIERLNDEGSYLDEDILIIIQQIKTLQTLHESGFHFDQVNLGNIPNRPETKAYGKTINLNATEVATIRELIGAGTNFTAQMVPSNPISDFNKTIKETEK
ncbi:MAG: PTS sugar transporter subunit IIB [Erysipelotrichaceae bacterium]|nr:PTS sugar transporter subunit IIB [Erysipelotrichaceae bacterium]